MSLLEMSLSGGILVLAVIVLRALALHRLPKRTFLALWAVAVLRLLIPFSLPSAVSVYTLADNWLPEPETVSAVPAAPSVPAELPAPTGTPPSINTPPAASASPAGEGRATWGWEDLWLAGVLLCAGGYLFAYIRFRREFCASLPVQEEHLTAALARRRLRRTVTLRQSDRVAAPLTYGVFRPVILLPSGTDWHDQARLDCVLEHELTHIRRFDALAKLALAAAACVHWFNPLVWCMYILANRDIELSCDEAVVRRMGVERRSEYAMALIAMEEQKSGLGPFASAFSKNAIEERITAIMKMKKRSLAAILAAVVLILGVSAAFATSAAGKDAKPRPNVQDGTFTDAEMERLSSLWFEGYQDMTVADYQEKMWTERDTQEDIELIDRYGQSQVEISYWEDTAATEEANAFNSYFYNVYEPLTAEQWKVRYFPGAAGSRTADGSAVLLEYTYSLTIPDPEKLTVGEYEQAHKSVKEAAQALADGSAGGMSQENLQKLMEEHMDELSQKISSDRLGVSFSYNSLGRDNPDMDEDMELTAQFSREVDAEWDRVLSPYVPFGLTYTFDDPDLDGNGLTMWFEGKEVRGIFDEAKGLWISEHSGISTYAADAVELYTVYTDGVLSGLRPATAEEQAAFTESRIQDTIYVGTANFEEREFPQATQADYDSFLALKTENYADMTLEEFNQRLLDWANENYDAYDRINCDVIWDDYGVDLTEEEKAFVSHTCSLSGKENGMMIRALYTGRTEEDPGFAANLPMRQHVQDNIMTAWCNLYYDLSYHVSDRAVVTVGERDRCTAAMKQAIHDFWSDTDLDTLLAMSEEDVVAQFNQWAAECGTEHVSFCQVTGDHIHYECADERDIYSDWPVHHEEPAHHSESSHHSSSHHG